MARTTSATQRQSFALATAIGAGQKILLNRLMQLGNGDLVRGIAVAVAVFLTITAAAIPHLPQQAVMAFLFLSGAGLALLVLCQPYLGTFRTFEIVKRAEITTPLAAPVSLPRTIAELLTYASPSSSKIGLASWANLTNRMSHELRTPLNAVLGFSELMAHEAFGPLGSEHYAEYVRNIHQGGRSLLKSSEDALAITALLTTPDRKGRNATVAAAPSIADAADFLGFETQARGLTVAIDASPDLEIAGDAATLRQIMINMLYEACDRAAPGATIAIQIQADGSQARLSLLISDECATARQTEESFSLLLARTLIELSGARLQETVSNDGKWQPIVSFERPVQPDFFGTLLH